MLTRNVSESLAQVSNDQRGVDRCRDSAKSVEGGDQVCRVLSVVEHGVDGCEASGIVADPLQDAGGLKPPTSSCTNASRALSTELRVQVVPREGSPLLRSEEPAAEIASDMGIEPIIPKVIRPWCTALALVAPN